MRERSESALSCPEISINRDPDLLIQLRTSPGITELKKEGVEGRGGRLGCWYGAD